MVFCRGYTTPDGDSFERKQCRRVFERFGFPDRNRRHRKTSSTPTRLTGTAKRSIRSRKASSSPIKSARPFSKTNSCSS
ncbi:MAG: hypothetical protein MZU97_21250 [Bacillus subtilis]|nr:hypothetical protein [Bacillus subtilis]